MALILIIIIFKIYLLTNIITIPMRNKRTSTFPASMFRVHECACVIKFHLGKWRPIRDPIFVVAETFIVSADIISILVDQNFTINVTGMVLESL